MSLGPVWTWPFLAVTVPAGAWVLIRTARALRRAIDWSDSASAFVSVSAGSGWNGVTVFGRQPDGAWKAMVADSLAAGSGVSNRSAGHAVRLAIEEYKKNLIRN